VRNPRGHPLVVAAPGGDASTAHTFGYDVRGPSGGFAGGEIAGDSSVLFFQPLETKKWLYEFRVASDRNNNHVMAGRNFMLGSYARRRAPFDTVDVIP
jgi:hypothetical protein